jgi:drug/metabolite transporter (DMT)-like permease
VKGTAKGPALPSDAPPPRVWAAFVLVVVAWGSSYLFIRLAIRSFTPFGLVATRFGLAALICLAMTVARPEGWPSRRAAAGFMLSGAMMMSGSNALTAWAQAQVPSGLTGVIHSLSSVWLAGLASLGLWSSPPPTRLAWVGIAAGVLGVAVLAWPASQSSADTSWPLLALVAATFIFVSASWVARRAQQLHPTGLFAPLCLQFVAGSVSGFILSGVTGQGLTHAALTTTSVGAMAVLTTLASVGGFAAFATVLKHWPAERLGSFSVINPLVSMLLGVLVLHEPLTARTVVGAAIILVGVTLVQLARPRLTPSAKTLRGEA